MDSVEYLRGIKRHWRMVAGFALIAFAFAWLSTLVVSTRDPRTLYRATSTLMQNGATNGQSSGRSAGKSTGSSSSTQTLPLQTIAALVTIPAVADPAARQLNYPGGSRSLAQKIRATVDTQSGMLRVSARAPTLENAEKIANAFATNLLAYLRAKSSAENNAQATSLSQQMNRIRQDIAALDRRLARYGVLTTAPPPASSTSSSRSTTRRRDTSSSSPADPLLEERDAALRQLGTLSQQYQEIRSRPVDAAGLSVFQTATGDGLVHPGIGVPRSLGVRLAGGFLLGLLGGIALAVIRERFDTRIKTKESAEDLFGYPVVAEIPHHKESRHSKRSTRPRALPPLVADAFRVLGAGLNTGTNGNGSSPQPARQSPPRVILVTSAGPKDGKTTVVANLASTLAQVGKTVLLLSCDFRHPDLHKKFGVPNEQGLAEALETSNGGPVLNACTWYTSVNGVWLVPSGVATNAPDQLLASSTMRHAMAEARQRCDVVLVDTSPVLTSDIAFLIPQVDAVLVVARAGRTKPDLAERSGELLKRLSAPVHGLVFTSDAAVALPRKYYRKRSLRQLLRASPGVAVHGVRRTIRVVRRGATAAFRRLLRIRRKAPFAGSASPTAVKPPTEIDLREFPDFRVGQTPDRR